jgi:hypothetical protein
MGHRTALITAGSVAVVIFAAAIAVGANLGILNAADSRPVGNLSASAAIKAIREPAGAALAAPQKYVIRRAGTVSVAATKTGLRLVDVTTRRGWRWTLTQTANRRLSVTFKSGSTVYRFTTIAKRHGRVVAWVDHPVTRVVPYAAVAAAPTQSVTSAAASTTQASTSTQPAKPASTSTGGGDDHNQGGADD